MRWSSDRSSGRRIEVCSLTGGSCACKADTANRNILRLLMLSRLNRKESKVFQLVSTDWCDDCKSNLFDVACAREGVEQMFDSKRARTNSMHSTATLFCSVLKDGAMATGVVPPAATVVAARNISLVVVTSYVHIFSGFRRHTEAGKSEGRDRRRFRLYLSVSVRPERFFRFFRCKQAGVVDWARAYSPCMQCAQQVLERRQQCGVTCVSLKFCLALHVSHFTA